MKKKRKKLAMLALLLAVFALLSPSPFEETNSKKTDLNTTKAQTVTTTVYEKAVKEEKSTVQQTKPNSMINIPFANWTAMEYTGETLFSYTYGAGWDELKQITTTASAAIASLSVVFLVLMKQKRQRDDEHYE